MTKNAVGPQLADVLGACAASARTNLEERAAPGRHAEISIIIHGAANTIDDSGQECKPSLSGNPFGTGGRGAPMSNRAKLSGGKGTVQRRRKGAKATMQARKFR